MPMVEQLARELRAEFGLRSELEDLVAFGHQGLLEASRRFDPSRGVELRTFAYYRVRGAILDGVRQMADLPRRAHEARRREAALGAVTERHATEADGAYAADAVVDFYELVGDLCASYVVSAATPTSQSAAEETPEAQLLGELDRARVRRAVGALGERERVVIHGMYFEDRPLAELGAELGVSRSVASRIHTHALGQLRRALR